MTLTLCDSISRQSPLAQIKFTLRLFRPETSLLCHLARGLSESMEHSRHIVCCFLVPCMSWLTTHLWILSWVLHPIHQKMQGCTHKSQIYTLNAQWLDTAAFLAFGSGARFKGAGEVAAESWSYLLELYTPDFIVGSESQPLPLEISISFSSHGCFPTSQCLHHWICSFCCYVASETTFTGLNTWSWQMPHKYQKSSCEHNS